MKPDELITHATGGLWMLPVLGFFMLLAMLPTILIETLVLRRLISVSWKQTMSGVAVGNVVSAIVGVPVSWAVMLAVGIVVFLVAGSPVYINSDSPVEGVAIVVASAAALGPSLVQLYWPIPMALAVQLIPCYFISVWIAYLVIGRMWKTIDRGDLWTGIRLAKGVTYGIMIAFCMLFMLAVRS